MPSTDSLADLITILDGEVRLLLNQDGVRVLIGLPRFLGFVDSEPRLSAALSVLREDVRGRESEFALHDGAMRDEIRGLWKHDERLFLEAEEAAKSEGKENLFHARGRLTSFESAINEPAAAAFPADVEIGRDPSRSGWLLTLLHHQHEWIREPQEKDRVGSVLRRLLARHGYEYKRLWLDGRNLAGLAFARLASLARSLNPPPAEEPSEPMKELVEAVFESDGEPQPDPPDLKRVAQGIRRDVELLHQALRTTLLLGRSPPGPVKPGRSGGRSPSRA